MRDCIRKRAERGARIGRRNISACFRSVPASRRALHQCDPVNRRVVVLVVLVGQAAARKTRPSRNDPTLASTMAGLKPPGGPQYRFRYGSSLEEATAVDPGGRMFFEELNPLTAKVSSIWYSVLSAPRPTVSIVTLMQEPTLLVR